MVFAFTFSVPTIPNPFSTQRAPSSPADLGGMQYEFAGGAPNPRKRAWLPATSSLVPSLALSAATSEPGYLDTPSKYLEAAAASGSGSGSGPADDGDGDEQEHGPPAKKRRTIADSIISTALSAALIGTAVGIAAYRVYASVLCAVLAVLVLTLRSWRDRGRPAQQQQQPEPHPEPEEKQPPPPPYHPGDWVSVSQESQPHQQTPHTLPKTARRTRRAHAAGHRRKTTHLHVPRHTPPPPAFSPRSHSPRLGPAATSDAEPEFEDHVDWMSSQLARLIEQGKRALGQEVVLPPDADAAGADAGEDDDEEAWMDEHDQHRQPASSSSYHHHHHPLASPASSSSHHFGSMRHGRTSPYLNTPPRSPLSASYPFAPGPHPHPLPPSASSASLRTPVSARLAADDEPGLSPELREHMARARAARRMG